MTPSVYEALLNSNAVIEFDVRGQILWANSNFLRLMGYELHEIQSQHHSIFAMDDEYLQPQYTALWADLAAGKIQTGEFKRRTKTGEEVWIQGSYTPVKDEDGEVYRIIKMAIDVTEKKRLAESLKTKNQELAVTATRAKAAASAKSIFLANMSHEIRTPLNSIVGISDSLAETGLNNDQLSLVNILQRASHQLITLINDILDISKIDADEIELICAPFDLKKLIEETLDVLIFRAREKGLRLTVTFMPKTPMYYYGDADRLRQVILNLIANAIKFTSAGEIHMKIGVNETSHPGNLLFQISDSGMGIPRAKFKDIFKPFVQADATITKRFGGTGLGLAISQKIVRLMGGDIWVESEIGSGSTFYFTAKLEKASAKQLPTDPLSLSDAAALASRSSVPLKILVADDVDDNRNLFGIYLQKAAHHIDYAKNGTEAVEMAKQCEYDVIFMDVQMPELDGYQATQAIRKFEKSHSRRPAQIIACTANAFADDIAKSHHAGCDAHLSKPIRKDTILKVLQNIPKPIESVG